MSEAETNIGYSAVEARIACADLIARFAYHVDHREFDEAVNLFDKDGVFERPDLTARGHAGIAAIWAERPESIITRHLCGPPCFLEVTDEKVRTVTNFTLYHLTHEGEGLPTCGAPTGIAEFHDEFRRTDAGWRIFRRQGIPVLLGAH